jgi:5-methylcytosine-specific restriction endonuclease McrA
MTLKRKKPRRKTSARKLKQKCDLLVRELVFARDGYKCVRCGKTDNLQAAHVLPKGLYQRLRFELDNVICLDIGCHLFWAHKDPLAFAEFIRQRYPGLEESLRERARTKGKVVVAEVYEQLRNSGM